MLVFLKLGGSLITDKDTPNTARHDVIQRLADELASALQASPGLRILLGHGSGSFGHVAARKHGTRQGVHSPEGWHGFVDVWRAARALNQIVLDALARAGLPAIAFPPSAFIPARGGKAAPVEVPALVAALEHGLVPVVQGDVAFDALLGGTILSTEEVFAGLARLLRPKRILLAGSEAGVWADYPACTRLATLITPDDVKGLNPALTGSASVDVTGGMREKVTLMAQLVQAFPGLEVDIFSGLQPGSLFQELIGENCGTRIKLKDNQE